MSSANLISTFLYSIIQVLNENIEQTRTRASPSPSEQPNTRCAHHALPKCDGKGYQSFAMLAVPHCTPSSHGTSLLCPGAALAPWCADGIRGAGAGVRLGGDRAHLQDGSSLSCHWLAQCKGLGAAPMCSHVTPVVNVGTGAAQQPLMGASSPLTAAHLLLPRVRLCPATPSPHSEAAPFGLELLLGLYGRDLELAPAWSHPVCHLWPQPSLFFN